MSQTIKLMQQLAASGIELKGVSLGSDPTVTPDQVATEISRSLDELTHGHSDDSPIVQWYKGERDKGLIGGHVSFFDADYSDNPCKVIDDLLAAEAAILAGQFREPPKATTEVPVEVMQILKESKVSK